MRLLVEKEFLKESKLPNFDSEERPFGHQD